MKTPTAGEARNQLRERLQEAGVAEPVAKADWWLAEQLGTNPGGLDDRLHEPLPAAVAEAWPMASDRLASGEPLSHVLGHHPFLGLDLACDSRALIPRPETEELVGLLLGDPGWWDAAPRTVIDVCTGSGCIALAIAEARPEAMVLGIDLDADALSLARENAARCGLERVEFHQGDLLSGWPDKSADLVVLNTCHIREKAAE